MQRVPNSDETDDDLVNQPYYFENISTEESVSILYTIKKEGAFLIRKRTTGDCQNQPYALSVYYEGKVHHTRITKEPNGQYKLGDACSKISKPFNSVKEIIKYLDASENCKLTLKFSHIVEWYKSKPPPTTPAKIEEVDNKPDQESLENLPFYLKNVKRADIERLLMKEIKENGVFFIRNLKEGNLNKSPYELLIYYKAYVYNLRINKSIYDKYSIEFNDLTFESIPEMVKYYNYEKLKISKTDLNVYLKIYCKYIQEEDF